MADSIKELCEFYGLDPVLISRELAEFRGAYSSVHSFVDVADLKIWGRYPQGPLSPLYTHRLPEWPKP